MRAAMVAAGAIMLAIAAWMHLAPTSAIDVWPWALTPLTTRMRRRIAAQERDAGPIAAGQRP